MKEKIGGYFELELPEFPVYHAEAVALNSGRFCLEYLLKCKRYHKIYVPYFTCDSAIEPIQKLGISYEFYHIDQHYHLTDEILLYEGEALMYTNYWGMHDDYCNELYEKYGNRLILDYTQAFYSRPISGCDTFYSCRKFFGVPDGGYLYTDAVPDFPIERDESYTRMSSLVKRIDLSPEDGYDDFRMTSAVFHQISVSYMSKFTTRMMEGIDYVTIAERRRANYQLLQQQLGGTPLLTEVVPMIYPYVCEEGQNLRKYLIQHKVFVAKYWPNVDEWAGEGVLETWMANHILPLPVDQRYGNEEMNYIIDVIKEYMNAIA